MQWEVLQIITLNPYDSTNITINSYRTTKYATFQTSIFRTLSIQILLQKQNFKTSFWLPPTAQATVISFAKHSPAASQSKEALRAISKVLFELKFPVSHQNLNLLKSFNNSLQWFEFITLNPYNPSINSPKTTNYTIFQISIVQTLLNQIGY